MGRVDESIGEAEQACRLDPTSVIANARLGWVLYLARLPSQAIVQCEKTLEIDPTFICRGSKAIFLETTLSPDFVEAPFIIKRNLRLSSKSEMIPA